MYPIVVIELLNYGCSKIKIAGNIWASTMCQPIHATSKLKYYNSNT